MYMYTFCECLFYIIIATTTRLHKLKLLVLLFSKLSFLPTNEVFNFLSEFSIEQKVDERVANMVKEIRVKGGQREQPTSSNVSRDVAYKETQ